MAALSLLFAELSTFISPKTIWWVGFFGLGYINLLIVNLCFVVFWAFTVKNKKLLVISAATILIGWPLIGRNIQIFAKTIPEEKLDTSIKIISFNVQGFEQMNNEQPNGEKLNMFDFFRQEAPDIICMQEYLIDNRRNIDATYVKKQLEELKYSHIQLPGGYFGIATFSRYPIIYKELVFSDKTTNACMCGDIVTGENDTVRLYNIHLKSVGFNNNEKHLLNNSVKKSYDKMDMKIAKSIIKNLKNASLERVKQVMILTEHISKSPYPVIICGDFNDPPTSYSYRKVRDSRRDAFTDAGSGRSATYDIGNIASLRIDYIIYSDDFRAYNYDSPRVYISDHFPVICRLVKNKKN